MRGVSGLGTGALAGTPGAGADHFSTEESNHLSANDQGSDNNEYIIDGLDVTSGIRQGVLNLTPNGSNSEVPILLKRLALLRQEATKEEREYYRHKLVESETQIARPAQP